MIEKDFENYITTNILCIKDYYREKELIFKKDSFYYLQDLSIEHKKLPIKIENGIYNVIIIDSNFHYNSISIQDFYDYFELKTKEEVRKEKIRKLLNKC